MNPDRRALAVVVGAVAYLAALTLAMTRTTYDVWGVLVVTPPLAVIGVALIRSMFRNEPQGVAMILYAGLGLKMIGTALRYWVGFEAYQGGIDAQRYHDYAIIAATDVWAGRANLFSVFPGGTGTPFTEGITAIVYTLTGTSKMGGFVVFSFLGFVGTVFFVKAACLAIPRLAARRYAVLCVLAPSLVYWPSSIGKDALLIFLLGFATLGIARLLAQPAVLIPLTMVAAGLVAAAYIRPHMVGIWLAGAFPALLVAAFRGRDPWERRPTKSLDRVILIPVIVIAGISLLVVSLATVRYLDPGTTGGDEASSGGVTSILDETTRRTEQAGSAFEPPSISSPLNWPFASIRTLTRPLIIEARGSAQLFTALEITIILLLCAVSWRRVVNVPRLVVENAYVMFAMTTLFLCGLAFTSFANLAVLARQRSIVFPFMLLIVCVPAIRRRPEHDPDHVERRPTLRELVASDRSQNSSTSPSVIAQFDSGGWPAPLTSRQVRTGPPPGRGAKYDDGDDIWA